MRNRLGRVRVVTALLALSSTSWTGGWAVAFHLATDDHHRQAASDRSGAGELETALHGHAHSAGTPAHSHAVVASVAAPVPSRLALLAPAMTGAAPEGALSTALGRRLPSQPGPNHDPPPRGASVVVLRI